MQRNGIPAGPFASPNEPQIEPKAIAVRQALWTDWGSLGELTGDVTAAGFFEVLSVGEDGGDLLQAASRPGQASAPLPDPLLIQPPVLRLSEPAERETPEGGVMETEGPLWVEPDLKPPLGYTGPSGILPRAYQDDGHFVPREDRWRAGFDEWDRYGGGHPLGKDYDYKLGHWWDPYNQNVLKGDYPIAGQHLFLDLSASSTTLLDFRQVPTPTTPFESTGDPEQREFFGRPNQFAVVEQVSLAFELFHGDAGFKPVDWKLKVNPVFNTNHLAVEELAIVAPDVRDGAYRARNFWALEEYFFEVKLLDLSSHYDFASLRVGSQPLVSDFRGFVFQDTNRAARLFGNYNANRDQYNLILVKQTEKDTNSGLNTFDDRDQTTVILNLFHQDFIFPGYTAELSYHYNHDGATFLYDKNGFIVRPDPVGVYEPHSVDSHYLGWAGDGHIDRWNISHAFYWVLGVDSLNPLAGQKQDINAQMAALELSYDRDYVRFRTSFFWASGDDDPNDANARGFDAIFDNPNFAGGQFSYWQHQAIKLQGVNLTNAGSLLPDLRSSKLQGQTNFVNPGLYLFNLGMDVDLAPKTRLISNANFLWFDKTQPLETFLFQAPIHRQLGYDLSLGCEYRPLLNDNLQITAGVSGLIPELGFKDIYNQITGPTPGLFAGFWRFTATY